MVLLLFSVIGTFFYGIGLLGFTPFLTCVVFARNSAAAVRQARVAGDKWGAWLLFAIGVLLAAAIPCLMQSCFGPWIETAFRSLPRPHELWMGGPLGLGR